MADIDFDELSKLIVQFQNGDIKAFEQIYNITYQTAKFTALKILNNNESDADDVIQDCYIKVMGSINTLKDPKAFMRWFNMVVANQAKSAIRKNNPHFYKKNVEEDFSQLDDELEKDFCGSYNDEYVNRIADDDYDGGVGAGESKKQAFLDETSTENYEEFLPGSDIEKEELRKTVIEMIDELSEEKKTAVILYYYNNMTTREISESIGISENTVKSRLVQAKKDLTKSVLAYEAKNGTFRGISPISLVVWALKNSAASVSITPFAASGIVAAGTAVAVGTTAAGTTAGTGVAIKIIAGILIAGVVTGGGIAGTRAARKHKSEEKPTTATTETYTEPTTEVIEIEEEDHKEETVIPSKPIEEYTVPDDKKVDTYFESGTLKYGVDYSIQRFANKNDESVSVYSSRPVLNRKNFNATYEELLVGATENQKNIVDISVMLFLR